MENSLDDLTPAYDFVVDGIYYCISNHDTVEVMHKDFWENDYAGNLIIPKTVTYDGKIYRVTTIGDCAFLSCKHLTAVTLPDSITKIGRAAFRYCENLVSINLPDSVTTIGEYAFHECDSLTKPIYNAHIFARLPRNYKGRYAILEGITGITTGAFSYCRHLKQVTIPDSVILIASHAFEGCDAITNITFPTSVKEIGDHILDQCYTLNRITCLASTPPKVGCIFNFEPTRDECGDIDNDAFPIMVIGPTLPIYVPAESIEAYQSAPDWKEFRNILPIE